MLGEIHPCDAGLSLRVLCWHPVTALPPAALHRHRDAVCGSAVPQIPSAAGGSWEPTEGCGSGVPGAPWCHPPQDSGSVGGSWPRGTCRGGEPAEQLVLAGTGARAVPGGAGHHYRCGGEQRLPESCLGLSPAWG